MEFLRTPDERFENLPDYPFQPNYLNVPDGDGGELRIHYVDEGPKDGRPVLLMHGEPSWSYLYRKMIPIITAAGHRGIAPDLVGFGRSDKPTEREDYTYAAHVAWMSAWLEAMDLQDITLFCQDWGGLLGLHLVAGYPDHFARVMASNTALPTGDREATEDFFKWREYSQKTPVFDSGKIISRGTVEDMSQEVVDAYNAPFPDDSYLAGARMFPTLVPASKDDPARDSCLKAWSVLRQFEKPFLCAYGDSDPIMAGAEKAFIKLVPGAKDQQHCTVARGGHFIQEDRGPEMAKQLLEFMG